MSPTTIKGDNVPIRLWANPNEVDSRVIAQLRNIARLPWVAHHVAVMPDVHEGRGATVGSVVALRGAVAPAAVGVDIGCGMAAARTNLRASDLPDSLRKLRDAIESAVPVGKDRHREFIWTTLEDDIAREGDALMSQFAALTAEVCP